MKLALRVVAVAVGVLVMAAGFAQVLAEPPVVGACYATCPTLGQCAASDRGCYVICLGQSVPMTCNSYYYGYCCTECPC